MRGDGGTQYEFEASYYYPINDNIALVPAFYLIDNPNNFDENPNIYVGKLTNAVLVFDRGVSPSKMLRKRETAPYVYDLIPLSKPHDYRKTTTPTPPNYRRLMAVQGRHDGDCLYAGKSRI